MVGWRKQQQRKRLAIPVFEPRAAPAAIDDQQPVGLWASDRVEDVGSRFEIQTLPQAGGSDDDLQQPSLTRVPLLPAALRKRRDCRIGRSGGSDDLVDDGRAPLENGSPWRPRRYGSMLRFTRKRLPGSYLALMAWSRR